ncbi:hypothetical protein ES695_07530 [Candidatus Atribacteria bacterium 1244-E10-H5-B2]|nr:MAG: hypothetical protein ES695_07530 [Candidatus Atribacteria bacterium 1244-E10-H5-B2]
MRKMERELDRVSVKMSELLKKAEKEKEEKIIKLVEKSKNEKTKVTEKDLEKILIEYTRRRKKIGFEGEKKLNAVLEKYDRVGGLVDTADIDAPLKMLKIISQFKDDDWKVTKVGKKIKKEGVKQ